MFVGEVDFLLYVPSWRRRLWCFYYHTEDAAFFSTFLTVVLDNTLSRLPDSIYDKIRISPLELQ